MPVSNLRFVKMSGAGNDFVVADNRGGAIEEAEKPPLARRACGGFSASSTAPPPLSATTKSLPAPDILPQRRLETGIHAPTRSES